MKNKNMETWDLNHQCGEEKTGWQAVKWLRWLAKSQKTVFRDECFLAKKVCRWLLPPPICTIVLPHGSASVPTLRSTHTPKYNKNLWMRCGWCIYSLSTHSHPGLLCCPLLLCILSRPLMPTRPHTKNWSGCKNSNLTLSVLLIEKQPPMDDESDVINYFKEGEAMWKKHFS